MVRNSRNIFLTEHENGQLEGVESGNKRDILNSHSVKHFTPGGAKCLKMKPFESELVYTHFTLSLYTFTPSQVFLLFVTH